MATAVQAPYSGNNAWDSQIVPTLRKRLENESRMLENRLSANHLSGDEMDFHPTPTKKKAAVQSSTAPFPTQQRSASQQNYYELEGRTGGGVGGKNARLANGISRPNQSGEPSVDGSRRPFTTATPTANASSRSGSSARHANGSVQNGISDYKRPRTQSTPYLFEEGAKPITINTTNGIPTPASSRANSPLTTGAASASSKILTTAASERPSKIPMRKRQRSNSQLTPSTSSFSSKPAGIGTGGRNKQSTEPVIFPPSPETSPELWLDRDRVSHEQSEGRHNIYPASSSQRRGDEPRLSKLDIPNPHGTVDRIKDERAPFNPKRTSRVSFEEREFEHWYRGEGRDGGGRNGGRGEIKLAKADTTKEMLEIAVGGHVIGKDRWAPRPRRQFDEQYRMEQDPDMAFVMDEPALTDMEGDAYATDYGQEFDDDYRARREILSQADMDLDDYYYSGAADDGERRASNGQQRRSASLDLRQDHVERTPSRASVAPSHRSRAPSQQSNRPPSRLRQPTQPITKSRRPSANTKEQPQPPPPQPQPQPRKSSGPAAPKTPDARSRTQSRAARQRAVSKGALSSSAGTGGGAMADAIPSFANSPPPKDGNWDDVVLPTVAKKMGLTQSGDPDVSMLGSSTDLRLQKEKEAAGKRVFEPAPGTFGYDSNKTRSSAGSPSGGEFGGKPGRRSDQSSSPSPKPPPSPPPFAAYMPRPPQQDVLEPMPKPPKPQSLVPPQEPAVNKRSSVIATSPTDVGVPSRSDKPDADDEGAGCCKCVIM